MLFFDSIGIQQTLWGFPRYARVLRSQLVHALLLGVTIREGGLEESMHRKPHMLYNLYCLF